MTTDVVIDELCNKFNVTINELIPKVVAYKETMLLIEIIAAAFFIILLLLIYRLIRSQLLKIPDEYHLLK